jgi:hypothetical protein
MPGRSHARRKKVRRADYDGAWKEALQQLLPEFLDLLFPAIYRLIDWEITPIFLEQELRLVTRRAGRSKQAVDKLVRVQLLQGGLATVLIHVEFQNQVIANLPDWLNIYNTLIHALFREPAVTLAVLGDRDPQWRPGEYRWSLGGFDNVMRFPMAKLLDYEAQWSELEQSSNPFAIVVRAHLKTLATEGNPETRFEWKLRLAKELYSRRYTEEQIEQLLEFIFWLMALDDTLEAEWNRAIARIEEEKQVTTLTPYKRWLIEQSKQEGREEGMVKARQVDVIEVLKIRLGPPPDDIIEAIRRLEPDRLVDAFHAALRAGTLDEFRVAL